ncbi:MAG: phospholipase D-like domain-containing protein [Bacteriovoracaceae bacterium]
MIQLGLKNIRLNQGIDYFYSAESFYQEMVNMIDQAQSSIILQTYIFHADEVGTMIIERLKKAAARGVIVCMVVDRLGSSTLPKNMREILSKDKINFGFFGNIKYKRILNGEYFVGRRMHHKVLLIDRKMALIGGINIGEPFLDWYDFAAKIQGPTCEDIFKVCYTYLKLSMKRQVKRLSKAKWGTGMGLLPLRVVGNDSLLQVNGLNRSLKKYFTMADTEVLIISAYFFPSRDFRKMLYDLVTKGVKVRVICGHLSDVKIMQYATTYYYEELIKRGIEVVEWMPTILHGKAFIIDDDILSVGSYNFNYMSYFTNIELNVEVYDKAKIKEFKDHVMKQLDKNTSKISLNSMPQDFRSKAFRFFAYWIVRFFSIISVIFIRNTPSVKFDEI